MSILCLFPLSTDLSAASTGQTNSAKQPRTSASLHQACSTMVPGNPPKSSTPRVRADPDVAYSQDLLKAPARLGLLQPGIVEKPGNGLTGSRSRSYSGGDCI